MKVDIYIKEWHDKEWFWKFLCIVIDNEALGFLERLLQSNSIEFKVKNENYQTW